MYKKYILISLLFSGAAFGSVINVPDDYTSIQDAIDTASSGDTVSVATGTYVENITMKDGVAVIGAGVDVCTINGNGSDRVVVCSDCSSEMRLEGFTITNGDAYRGGGMYNSNSTVAVANCLFESNTASYGGGVLNDSSSITFTGCTFSGNTATTGGGMLNRNASDVTILNCTFTENTSENNGGAIRNTSSSTVTVTGCSFTDNIATNTNAGGIFCESGTMVTVTDCTLSRNFPKNITGDYTDGGGNTIDYCVDIDTDNPAHYRSIQDSIDAAADGDIVTVMPGRYYENLDMSGKAITLQSSDPTEPGVVTSTIIDGSQSGSVITCNSGETADAVINGFVITNGSGTEITDGAETYHAGGGVYNGNSSSTISNCTLISNNADKGSGMYNENSSSIISNCAFISNNASEKGGGMYNENSPTTIHNCIFSSNTAAHSGGGMKNEDDSPTMTNSSFCENMPQAIDGVYIDKGGNNLELCLPPQPADSNSTIDGDINGDGKVNMADFAAFAENWLTGIN